MSEFIPGIVLVATIVVAISCIFFFVGKQVREMNARIRKQLDEKGFVVDFPVMGGSHHQLTRIWQLLDEPTPYYLHVSSLDPIASAAGMLGIADIRTGNGSFDAEFVVRTNNRELVKDTLTGALQEELLSWGAIRFRTGAIDGILSVDYLPEIKTGRSERRLWAIEVRGKLEQTEIDRLLGLGFKLRDAVKASAQLWAGPKDFKVAMLEGR